MRGRRGLFLTSGGTCGGGVVQRGVACFLCQPVLFVWIAQGQPPPTRPTESLCIYTYVSVSVTKYGHLPKMTVTSKGVMGSLMTSSFCERINSSSNLVCTKNNNLLSDDEIDMAVTLRMNRDFMEHVRISDTAIVSWLVACHTNSQYF
jgi:hypothetical protein